MSANPPPPGNFGRSFEEVMDRIEMELRQAVNYVNDAVVPQVRRESITAMRQLADTLRNLADRFEASNRPAAAPPKPGANPSEKDPRS